MTTFYLMRHALHAYGGERIAGRQGGVPLSPAGVEQAMALGERMKAVPLAAIYTSPLERTQATAEEVARHHRIVPVVREELSELDFGDWTGRPIAELDCEDRWKRFNAYRSGTRAPNGELMIETQRRIVALMAELREAHPGEALALVSHGDVVKSAVAYCLGVPLDLLLRIEIGTASVSVVGIGDYGPWILGVNLTERVPLPPK